MDLGPMQQMKALWQRFIKPKGGQQIIRAPDRCTGKEIRGRRGDDDEVGPSGETDMGHGRNVIPHRITDGMSRECLPGRRTNKPQCGCGGNDTNLMTRLAKEPQEGAGLVGRYTP